MVDKSNSRCCLASFVLLLLILCGSTMGKTIYVDDDAAGANNGSSWENAYVYLQDALADANSAEKPVEIRIAQGVYTPDQGAGITRGDPRAEFQLINGVAVLGGFAGVGIIESDVRNIEAYETILSGDLSSNDADADNPEELYSEPTRAENSICVVCGNRTDQTAVLDGVTITAGSTGIRNWYGNPTLLNCILTNTNTGMDNYHSSQTLIHCIFEGHWPQSITQISGSLILIDCLFTSNTGGINSTLSSELTLQDCTFVGDGAMKSEVAINCRVNNLKLYNCKFSRYVLGGRSCVNVSVDREFIAENCIFTGIIGGAIEHDGGRLIVSNCVFAGNIEGTWSGGIYSDSQYTTIRNCTFSGNSGKCDGGALNLREGGKVSNCIFWGNSQPAIDGQEQDLFVRYCDVQGGWQGEGNIDIDPRFVLPGYWDMNNTPENTTDDFWVDGDYHLCSQAGHWNQQSQAWVQDDVTSPCIDAGDPNSPIGTEPFPNGGRLNMGAYGAGGKASKSYFGEPVCETIIAGDINGDCVVDFEDLMIIISHWMMRGEDLVNNPPTIRLIEPQDGDRITWRGSTTFRAEASDVDGQVDEVWFRLEYRSDNNIRYRRFGDLDGSDGWEIEFTWPEDADFGEWIVWAEAMDNDGQIGITPEITVTLYRP